ncbi:hypothetical protein B0H66DRAFT_586236 [Apodospora peruviana]|uniref:Uncharacterized protein n=1 Tax=Apodospora peruviana TaxID=516989 RepID=A0AAE0IRL9_9PEZI|nr:hypothetical protein B0H66DRAFT_586236 [Apodospora peruviana]
MTQSAQATYEFRDYAFVIIPSVLIMGASDSQCPQRCGWTFHPVCHADTSHTYLTDLGLGLPVRIYAASWSMSKAGGRSRSDGTQLASAVVSVSVDYAPVPQIRNLHPAQNERSTTFEDATLGFILARITMEEQPDTVDARIDAVNKLGNYKSSLRRALGDWLTDFKRKAAQQDFSETFPAAKRLLDNLDGAPLADEEKVFSLRMNSVRKGWKSSKRKTKLRNSQRDNAKRSATTCHQSSRPEEVASESPCKPAHSCTKHLSGFPRG